jgi:hypothetical protein
MRSLRLSFKNTVSDDERCIIDLTWNAQEDFTNGENALVVVDGSGSMYGGGEPLPASVALSLGVFLPSGTPARSRTTSSPFHRIPGWLRSRAVTSWRG